MRNETKNVTLAFLIACLFAACALVLPSSPVGSKAYTNERETVMVLAPIMEQVGEGDTEGSGIWQEYAGRCTGVVVAPKLVVTASHCVQHYLGTVVGSVTTRAQWEMNNPSMIALLVAEDAANDLALLAVPDAQNDVARLGPVPSYGDSVHMTDQRSLTPGWQTFFGSYDSETSDGSVIVLRAQISVAKGASGAGLFDAQGRLVGICLSYSPRFANFASASKVAELMRKAAR